MQSDKWNTPLQFAQCREHAEDQTIEVTILKLLYNYCLLKYFPNQGGSVGGGGARHQHQDPDPGQHRGLAAEAGRDEETLHG